MFDRLRKRVDRVLNGRYYDHVPEDIRELAEKHHLPKPNRFVPSIGGSPSPAQLRGPNDRPVRRLRRVKTSGQQTGPSLVPSQNRTGPISVYQGDVPAAADAVVATRARMRGQQPRKTFWRRIFG